MDVIQFYLPLVSRQQNPGTGKLTMNMDDALFRRNCLYVGVGANVFRRSTSDISDKNIEHFSNYNLTTF